MPNNVTRVQGTQNTTSTSSWPTTAAFVSDVTAGDLIVIFARLLGISSSPSFADTVGTTYAEVSGGNVENGSSYVTFFLGVAGGSGPNTVTITGGGSNPEFVCGQYHNPDGDGSFALVGTPQIDANVFKFSPWITGALDSGLDELNIVGWTNETGNTTFTGWNGPSGFVLRETAGQNAFTQDLLSSNSIVNWARVISTGGTRAYISIRLAPNGVASNTSPRQRQVAQPNMPLQSSVTAGTIVFQKAMLSTNSYIVVETAAGATSVTDTESNTYTKLSTLSFAGYSYEIWVAPSTTTGTPTVTAHYSSGTNTWMAAWEMQNCSGVDTVTPSTASGFPSPGTNTLTPTSYPALVRAFLYIGQTAATSPLTPTGDSFATMFQEDDNSGADSFSAQFLVQDLLVSSGSATQSETYPGFSRWGSIMLAFDGAPAGPTINSQPADVTKKPGETATFSVTATTSGGSLSYQWKDDGGVLTGETASSYTTGALTLGDNGNHVWCSVTDSNGTVDTRHALISVKVGRVIVVVMM